MPKSNETNNDVIIEMPDIEIESKSSKIYRMKDIMMIVFAVVIGALLIVGAAFIINKQLNKANQTHSTADESPPVSSSHAKRDQFHLGTAKFSGKFKVQGKSALHAFQVESSANLKNVYEQIKEKLGFPVWLQLRGRFLANDGTPIKDIGMTAGCVVDVLPWPKDDLQILERAVTNPNDLRQLWDQLIKFIDCPLYPGLKAIGHNYESFEAFAKEWGTNVMKLAEAAWSGWFAGMKVEDGNIVMLQATSVFGAGLVPDLNALSQLPKLSKLSVAVTLKRESKLDLSALGKMKEMKEITLFLDPGDYNKGETITVVIPDMSECKQLKKIYVVGRLKGIELKVDCTGSHLDESKVVSGVVDGTSGQTVWQKPEKK